MLKEGKKLNQCFIVLLFVIFNLLFITKASAENIVKTLKFDYSINHILVNPIDNKVYLLPFVFNNNENKHLVLNGETGDLLDTFRIEYPGGRPAINPSANKLYITDYKSLNVIDLSTKTIVDSVELEEKASGVHLNPKTNKIYVNLFGSDYNIEHHYPNHKGIAIVDGYSNQVLKTILPENPNEVNYGGTLIQFDNVSNLVYIGRLSSNVLYIFDSITDTLIRTINLPFTYTGEVMKDLSFNEKEQKLYITTNKNRLLSWNVGEERYSSEVTLKTLDVNDCFSDLALNPDTNKLYVKGTRGLVVVDCSKDKILQVLKVSGGALVDLNPATKTIFAGGLTDDGEHLLSIIKDDGNYGLPLTEDSSTIPTQPTSPNEPNSGTESTNENGASNSGFPIKPFFGGIGVKGGNKSSLSQKAQSLLYELIDSMNYLGSKVKSTRQGTRKVIQNAKMLLRVVGTQSDSCSEAVAYFLNKIESEISRLNRLNHSGTNSDLTRVTEGVLSELSNLLIKDNNMNNNPDVCESLN